MKARIELFYRFCVFGALLLLLHVSVFAEDRAVPTTYSSWLETVNAPYAWNLGFTGKNVVVGVIDDSIDMTHPFFGSNIDTSLAYNTGVIYNNEIYKQFMPNLPTQSPNDTSAVWDKANVKNPTSGLTSPSQDDHHGTCVTGCIAAYDAESNTYGPAYDATIAPIRVDFPCQAFDLKLDGPRAGELAVAQAISLHNSKIDIKNNSYGMGVGFYVLAADEKLAALADAKANNTIMLYSAGNERNVLLYPNGKNCTKKLFTSHPYTITVAATGANKTTDYTSFAPFSNYGSSVFITAPGVGIQTADREDVRTGNVFTYREEFESDYEFQGAALGNVNEAFSGTSASSPIAVGVLALALDAYKTTYPGQVCDVRFIKHLLARTSTKIDTETTKLSAVWRTNAAGLSFSHSYGFGQINAKGLIDAILDPETVLGGRFDTVTPQTVATLDWSTMDMTAEEVLAFRSTVLSLNKTGGTGGTGYYTMLEEYQPGQITLQPDEITLTPMAADGDEQVYFETKTFTDQMFLNAGITKQPLEEVVVTFSAKADDPEIGFDARYMEVILDHNGLQSYLVFSDKNSIQDNIDDLSWSFSSNSFWGEDPTGDWTLKIANLGTTDTFQVFDIFSTFYMGALQNSVPEPSAWILLLLGGFGLALIQRKKTFLR